MSLLITGIKHTKFYLYLAECNSAFGLEGGIEDRWFSALSYHKNFPNGDGKGFDAHPRCARLNYHDCAWCAASENGQYLQVDLKSEVVITAIATQGFQTWSDSYFVTWYTVGFSRDRKTWNFLPVSINLILCKMSNIDDCNDYKIF